MAKYNYEDYNQHITLLEGIEDIQPYFIKLPDAPKPEKFINFGLPKEEQFFKREHIPTKVRNLNAAVKTEKITIDEAIKVAERDDDISSFIVDQWEKRAKGIFIYIYGKPVYIPYNHWYYLNYHPLDTGKLPDFRFTDLNYWYWRKFCVWDNPKVYGGINFTNRREGKSVKSGSELCEVATRRRYSLCGIQSKNDGDAKSFFRKFVARQIKKLPFWFKPITDGNKNPASEIKFEWGKGASDSLLEPLDTIIDYRASVPVAYDGEKLVFYILDEAGKFVSYNPFDTWDKVKYCLLDEDRIIGKAIITTTVEEMEKGGGRAFKELWDNSSLLKQHNKVNELGQTNSGLIPFFTPAYMGYIFDQYGFSIVNNPLPYQQKYRFKKLIEAKHDPTEAVKFSKMGAIELLNTTKKNMSSERERADFTRKYPFTIKQAFISANRSCHFSLEKINAALEKYLYTQRETLEGHPFPMTQGNFEWENGIRDTKVFFRPSPNGRWIISYLLPQAESNKWEYKGRVKIPQNTMKGVSGGDPYGFSILAESNNKPSKGSGYVWWQHEPMVDTSDKTDWEYVTDDFIVEYIARPASRDQYNEDMIMMSVYYGVKFFPEINKDHTMNYFVDRGYEGYLLFPRKAKREHGRMVVVEAEKAGAYSVGDKYKDPIFSYMEWYVENRIQRCKFPRLIEDIKDVEYAHTAPYDAFMGAGYCLYAAKMIQRKPSLKKESYDSPISSRSVIST